MSRYGVHRRVLLTCVLAVAACTEPTFDERSEAGSAARGDAAAATATRDTGDTGAMDDERPDAASSSGFDSAQEPPIDGAASSGSDTGAPALLDGGAAVDGAVATTPEAQVPDVQVPDTQVPDEPPPDSGSPTPQPDAAPPDPVPTWAKPLLGRFVKRSVYFAYDTGGPVITVTIDVSLLDISASSSGQLELSGQQCGYRVYWSDGGASYTLVKPQGLPRFHMWLSLGQAPHFTSDTAPLYMGYDPTRQSRCTGSAYADKFPDQTWLTTGRCACTGAPEVMPTESNDCRVTDPDSDGKPGVALDGAGLAPDITGAINTTTKITDGEVRADGEHLLREQHTRNVACLGSCFSMNDQLCPGGETQIRPLPASATCAEALAKVDPLPYPPFPTKDCRAK